MPTYEYKREDGSTFEVKQSINDDALERCPETGQKVKRIISGGGGVVYKGDGWYVTAKKSGLKLPRNPMVRHRLLPLRKVNPPIKRQRKNRKQANYCA